MKSGRFCDAAIHGPLLPNGRISTNLEVHRCRYFRLSSLVVKVRICSAAAVAAYYLAHAVFRSDSPKSTTGRCSWSVREARLLSFIGDFNIVWQRWSLGRSLTAATMAHSGLVGRKTTMEAVLVHWAPRIREGVMLRLHTFNYLCRRSKV